MAQNEQIVIIAIAAILIFIFVFVVLNHIVFFVSFSGILVIAGVVYFFYLRDV